MPVLQMPVLQMPVLQMPVLLLQGKATHELDALTWAYVQNGTAEMQMCKEINNSILQMSRVANEQVAARHALAPARLD